MNKYTISAALACLSTAQAIETKIPYLSIQGEFVHETTSVISGGVNEKTSSRELLVIDAELDLEKPLKIPGGTLFAQFQHATAERGGTMDTGDIQAFSNLEVESSIDELYEFWYQQELFNGKLRLKVGKVDANTEFNYVNAAGGFANSSGGFSPTIFTFPTYPNPAMSVNLFWQPTDTVTLSYGYYDGSNAVDGIETGKLGPSTFFSSDKSDDYFHILQIEKEWSELGSLGAGRASAGIWHHTGDFATFSGGTDSGTTGFFLTFEQQLIGTTEDQGYFGFAQYGWADEEVSEIAQHIAFGLVARSTGITREGDEAGIYVSYVDLSDEAGAGFSKDETAIDLYYNFSMNDSFSLQPEIQYIFNPSGSAVLDDAFVAGIRASITF